MTKFAYSYVRFSSTEQAKGDSERRQRAAFDTYCNEHGLTPATDTFADKGKSGYKGEHLDETGELRRFLTLAQGGMIPKGSTLVVENLDRLGRMQPEEAYIVFNSILAADIRIVTLPKDQPPQEFLKGGLDIVKLLMVLVEMSRAHSESKYKSDRLSAVFAEKQTEARTTLKPMGAACPMWLRLTHDDSAYELIPERAKVVERIFRETIDGHGRGVIAKRLNAEGIPSFKAGRKLKTAADGIVSGLWGTSSVDKILKNRATFGEYQPMTSQGAPKGKTIKNGDSIPGYFPPVVSADTFYEAQAAIDGRRSFKATKQSEKFNLWQGIAKCEKCGANLHMRNTGAPPKGGTYLRCANAAKGGGCSCRAVRIEQADAVFKSMLIRLDALALVQDSSAAIERNLRAVEGQKAEAKRKLVTLEKALHGEDDEDNEAELSPTILAAVKRVEARVKALERQESELKAELAAEQGIGWDEFLNRLDLVSYEGRAKANALVKRLGVIVMVGPSGYGITQKGEPLFGMDYRDGEAGFFMAGPFRSSLPQFFPMSEIPRFAQAEEAAAARESEGELLMEAEAAALLKALDE